MAPTKVSQSGKAAVSKPRVLVVDDEADLLEVITETVGKKLNCRLVTAKNVAQARKVLESQKIDLLLTDVNLPDGDGTTLLPALRRRHPTAVRPAPPIATGGKIAFARPALAWRSVGR